MGTHLQLTHEPPSGSRPSLRNTVLESAAELQGDAFTDQAQVKCGPCDNWLFQFFGGDDG